MAFVYLLLAIVIDKILAEPKMFHPLVGFGFIASWLELKMNNHQIISGFLAWCLVVLPVVALAYYSEKYLGEWVGIIWLYLAIGYQSLKQHGLAVHHALMKNDTRQASQQTQQIVSRNMEHATQKQSIKATTESILENSNDAIFAPIFWFLVAGSAGVVLYRLVNTLDAMWGYKNNRFLKFGRWSARVDDVLNWLPARLTVVGFTLVSLDIKVLRAAKRHRWYSPNAGPVMAAGAYALKVRLGGGAFYHGQYKYRRLLGGGQPVNNQTIVRAISLIEKNLLVILFITGVMFCLNMVVNY